MMEIRMERADDWLEVENLVRDSFWNIYRPGAYEHFIVHQLRNDDCFITKLAYVIESDGNIIGNINYSMGKLKWQNHIDDAVILGPIAIDKDHQNQGLGTRLIEYTLNLAKDYPYVFVVGDENYYSRFGFKPASKYNIYLEGTDSTQENPFFMIKINDLSKLPIQKATFHNPEVFDVSQEDVDEFDKKFEFRQKLVLEGQLGV